MMSRRLIFVFCLALMLILSDSAAMAQQRRDVQEPPMALAELLPDQEAVLNGIDGGVPVPDEFSPGAVCLFGDEAFPILLGGNRRIAMPLLVGSRYENGRVAIFGHSGLIGGNFCKSSPEATKLALNLVQWLAQSNNAQKVKPLGEIRVAVIGEQGTAAFLTEQGVKADDFRQFSDEIVLEKYDLIIFGAEKIRDNQIPALDAFVKNGGGLLSAATGWGWQMLNPAGDLKTTFAGNKLFAPMGVVWSGQFVEKPRDGYTPARRVSKFLHPKAALDAVLKTPVDTTLTAADWSQIVASLELVLGCLPEEQAAMFSELHKLIDRQVVPTKQKPVVGAQQPLDRLAMLFQTQRYMHSQNKNGLPEELVVPKFDAATEFPGDIPADAKRVSRTVEIDTIIPDWHSTGLYAAPGDVITITIPEGAANRGRNPFRVRIGALTDRLWHLEKWERYPEISLEVQLTKPVTKLVNPFGGHVYFVVPRNVPQETVKVQIDGAVEAPYYVFGATTDEQWQKSRTAPGPWAELASDRVVITVPSHLVRELDNPKELMQFWNGVLDADAKLAGWPQKRVRPERITADRQISAGWMHSGYPVMTPTQTERGLVDLAYLKERGDRWGFFHEFGHNHQSGDWTFNGTVEVTVNLFSLYNYEKQYGTPIAETRREMRPEVRRAAKAKYIADGADFNTWKSDPFLALGMYVELIEEFGWESFIEVFGEYRELPPNERPRNDDAKRDQWMCRFSKKVGKNLGPFFDQWGVPVSQEAKDSIADLPVWLPE
jgi:hypothetical protein